MEVLHDDVRSVSGIHFRIMNTTDFVDISGKVSYLLYLKHDSGQNIYTLRKFIRMFAIPFRMVLIHKGNMDCIGFILFMDKSEQQELDSMMEWTAISHPEWIVTNFSKNVDVPDIIGLHIANNLFHARKLVLQGELLD